MYKLLVVEDEMEMREGLACHFPWEDLGFRCVGACENGFAALEFLRREVVDVVITDISMPDCTGIDLAQTIRETGAQVKIIFLTAYKNFDYAMSAIHHNVSYYLLKPADYDQIVDVFSKLKLELDMERETDNPQAERYNQVVIDTVKQHVSEQYGTATLETAAQAVHLNPSYLSRFFKKETGQTFSDFLMEIRMKKAAKLIMDIHFKLYEVSEAVGYTNTKNFTRAFKGYFGLSPSQYRNKKTGGTL